MVEIPPQQQPLPSSMAPTGLGMLTGVQTGLPSLALNTPMLPSMDPQMDQQVASQYGQVLIQQSAAQLQELMVLSGDFTTTMRHNLEDLHSVSTNLSQINQILSGALQGLQQTSQQSASGLAAPARGRPSSMAPTGLTEGADPNAPAEEAPDTRTLGQRFTEGRQMANRQSMGQVARQMAGRASQALQEQEGHWDLTPDENGNINYTDPSGNITRTAPATEDNIARAGQDMARMRRASGLLGRVGRGESLLGGEGGLLGGLGEGALKAAGPIGLAVGVAKMGFDQFNSQTAAGAPYRAARGQDAGRFAFSDRLDRLGTKIGGYFSGNPEAANAFDQATQQGLSGDRRDQAVDFMNRQYLKFGLDAQTSAQAVKIATDNTNISLSTLSDQITKVSDSAVAAGKSSEDAITSFVAATQQVQQNISNTGQAPVIAGDVQNAIAQQLPSSLNNAQTLSGMLGAVNPMNIAMQAQRTGQTFGQVSAAVATSQGGAAQQVIGGSIQAAVESICRAGGAGSSTALKADIGQMFPGVAHLNSDQQYQVLTKYPNITPIIPMVFAQYGVQVTPGNEATYFFEMLMSDISQLGQPGSKGGPKTEAQVSVAGGAKDILGSTGDLSSEGMKALGMDVAPGTASVGGGRAANNIAATLQSRMSSSDVTAYTKYASSSGNRDLAAEGTIKDASAIAKYAGKGSLSDVSFKMADGSTKSFAEILSDKSAMAELDAGTVTIQSGANKNDSQELKDFIPDSVTGGSGAAPTSGKSVSAGGVTISLANGADRLFNLTGPSDAQSQGVPPSGSSDPNQYGQ